MFSVKKYQLSFCLTLIASLITFNNIYSQDIEHIDAVQRGSNIVISYEISGKITSGKPYYIKIFCSEDNGKNWGQPLNCVYGDIGDNVLLTTGKKQIIWDVLGDKDGISHKKMSIQEQMLDKTLSDWRGEMNQIDDILIFGVKIS